MFVEDDWALVRMDLGPRLGAGRWIWTVVRERNGGLAMWMVKKRWIQVMSGWLTQ